MWTAPACVDHGAKADVYDVQAKLHHAFLCSDLLLCFYIEYVYGSVHLSCLSRCFIGDVMVTFHKMEGVFLDVVTNSP